MAPSFKLANAVALVVGCSVFLTACAGKEREVAVTPSKPEPSSGQAAVTPPKPEPSSGQAAVTPPKQEPSPGQEVIYVVVQRGQNLDRIAQRYHVEKSDVIAANQLKPPYTLEPGAILMIPVAKVKSVKQSATIGASPASANRDGVVQRKAKRPKPELIEPDDVPTHSSRSAKIRRYPVTGSTRLARAAASAPPDCSRSLERPLRQGFSGSKRR